METVRSQSDSNNNEYIRLISIHRPLFTKETFNQYAGYNSYSQSLTVWQQCTILFLSSIRRCFLISRLPKKSGEESSKQSRKYLMYDKCRYFGNSFFNWLTTVLPIIRVLRNYRIRSWLLNDMIAGFTVGIMHVPQGMAYALVATLPPVYGLYTSFFPSLIYFFLGTSRHISVGTMAVVSLLTGDFLDRVIHSKNPDNMKLVTEALLDNKTNHNISITDIENLRIHYATALGFSVGILQFGMGLFRLGSLIRYFSVPMTSGFTVGVAVHVFTTQLTNVLGLRLPRFPGLFTIPFTYYEIFRTIQYVSIPTVLLSSTCITILAVYKDWISPYVMKILFIPIPVDLIIVILSTIVSYSLDLNGKYNMKIVGKVSKGIQYPEVPDISLMGPYIGDIVTTAVVGISVSVSLARIFATRFNYKMNTNQELIAFGLTNSISSFFHSYPAAASLSRSAVAVSAGGRSQVFNLFSCLLLILVLCFIGPLFYSVPVCCLSAIIIVAIKGMLLEAKDLLMFWRFSVWDSVVWMLTFLSTVLLSVNYGLLLGVVISAVVVILRLQWPKIHSIEQVRNTEIYQNSSQYTNHIKYDKIKIIRYEGNLFYFCAEHFRETVYLQTGVNPVDYNLKLNKCLDRIKQIENMLRSESESMDMEACHQSDIHITDVNKLNTLEESPNNDGELTEQIEKHKDVDKQPYRNRFIQRFIKKKLLTLNEKLKLEAEKLKQLNKLKTIHHLLTFNCLIFDCSYWSFIDIVGADELKQVISNYEKLGVIVLLAQMKDNLIHTLQTNNKIGDLTKIYPTVHDAVNDAIDLLNKMKVKEKNLPKHEENLKSPTTMLNYSEIKSTDISTM
ncbi:Solute carrier family 26 member 6 [Schistosoma japonicum]|nr:Solute carrier family 26 member 6 [Schistosoma japonicum]KAH8870808.1 Solute carrier family 26 member 6 [Schistosoma japonicum]